MECAPATFTERTLPNKQPPALGGLPTTNFCSLDCARCGLLALSFPLETLPEGALLFLASQVLKAEDRNPEGAWKHRWPLKPPLRTSSLRLHLCAKGQSRSQGQRPRLRVGKRAPPRATVPLGRFPQSRAASTVDGRGRPRGAARATGTEPRGCVALGSRPLCQQATPRGLPWARSRPPLGGFGRQPCSGKPRVAPCAFLRAPGLTCSLSLPAFTVSSVPGRWHRPWTAPRPPDAVPLKTVRLALLRGRPQAFSHGGRFTSVCPMPREPGDRRGTACHPSTPRPPGNSVRLCTDLYRGRVRAEVSP